LKTTDQVHPICTRKTDILHLKVPYTTENSCERYASQDLPEAAARKEKVWNVTRAVKELCAPRPNMTPTPESQLLGLRRMTGRETCGNTDSACCNRSLECKLKG